MVDFRKGRNSKFDGMRLFKLVDDNPRRKMFRGKISRAWKSWELIFQGMTYEEFKAAGGNTHDLRRDVERGRVELELIEY